MAGAFRGSTGAQDPLARLQSEFASRADRLRTGLGDITRQSANLKTPLKSLEAQAVKTGAALRKDLDGALGILSPRLASVAGAVGPLTASLLGVGAVVAGGVGLFELAKHAADAGDEIFDLTQKVNFSAETISALKNAGKTAGVEFGAVSAALGIFNKNIEAVNQGDKELSKTFRALKIDTRDNEAALRSAFKALIAVEDGAQQTALAMKVFGRSGKEVLGVIKDTNGDLDRAIEKYRELGTLITSETARAANEFSDKLALLEQKFDAVARAVGERFMPIVSDAMDKVNAALDKNKATAQNWATDLVSIVEFAATQIGHILEGLRLVIEGFRKTFGEGSFFGDAAKGVTMPRLISLGNGQIKDLSTGKVFTIDAQGNITGGSGYQALGIKNVRSDDAGEFAIAGGAGDLSVGAGPGGSMKKGGRLDITKGGGGAKTQRDILESLRGTLINLNAEWRKWDIALLDSASATAEAAQKQQLLDNVMSSLSSKTKLEISAIKDIDEALSKAVSSLPKKSQDAARALIAESMAQFRANEERRIASELSKEAERVTQAWRVEIDNSRAGADEFTKAIHSLEQAYAKYGKTLEPATRAELEQLAAQQRILKLTRERLTVLNQIRQRVVGEDVLKDLGGGSVVFRGDATRERVATADEQVRREREQARVEEMRQIAEDLGEIFADSFDAIGHSWDELWRDMAQTAKSIGRAIIRDLFTGLFSRTFNVPFSSQSGGIVGAIVNGILGGGRGSQTDLGGGSTFTPGGTGATRPRVAGARALGGPVEAGLLYRVNENRTEYFRPNVGGQVIPLGQAQEQALSISRLFIVADERAAFERGAARREIMRANKQMRKVGKLVPGLA